MAFEWLDTAVRGFLGSVELASHLSTIGSFGLAIGAAAATAPALGIVPRVGPLRALSLGFSSFLRRPSMTFSDRSSVVTVLNRKLAKLRSDRYIVCVGPRGVGKSTVVNTVVRGKFGVVVVEVTPSMSAEAIITSVYRAVIRTNVSWVAPETNAKRVIKWYRRIFQARPIVVLRVRERDVLDEHSQLPAALLTLCEQSLAVLVDASHNSIPPLALSTLRQSILELGEMDVETLVKVKGIRDVVEATKRAGVFELAFAVLGGVPTHWMCLAECLDDVSDSQKPEDIKAATYLFCKELLSRAGGCIKDVLAANPAWAEIYDRFKPVTVDELPVDVLDEVARHPPRPGANELPARPWPEKVLRRVYKRGADEQCLMPTTAAMLLVLRYGNRGKPPPLHLVEELVCRSPVPADAAKLA